MRARVHGAYETRNERTAVAPQQAEREERRTKDGKAVGTRDRVVAYLALHGDLEDESGMASTIIVSRRSPTSCSGKVTGNLPM